MLGNNNRQRTIRIIAVAMILALWFWTSATTAFFWTIFLIWAAWRLDARWVGIVALMLLIVLPILLALGQDVWAELLAVYVYFLMTITVALQAIDLFLTRKNI